MRTGCRHSRGTACQWWPLCRSELRCLLGSLFVKQLNVTPPTPILRQRDATWDEVIDAQNELVALVVCQDFVVAGTHCQTETSDSHSSSVHNGGLVTSMTISRGRTSQMRVVVVSSIPARGRITRSFVNSQISLRCCSHCLATSARSILHVLASRQRERAVRFVQMHCRASAVSRRNRSSDMIRLAANNDRPVSSASCSRPVFLPVWRVKSLTGE